MYYRTQGTSAFKAVTQDKEIGTEVHPCGLVQSDSVDPGTGGLKL